MLTLAPLLLGMGVAVVAPLAVAPPEEAAPGPSAGFMPGGMAAGGHGGGSWSVFGRELCPGAHCQAGKGVGAAGGTRGQWWLFHPILLCPAPAHRDMALLGYVCCLLRLQELVSGWTAPSECGQGGGAEGAESFPAWTRLGN